MVERILFGPGGSTEAKQDQVLASLANILTELQQKFEPGQQVALDSASLAALETVNAIVSGTVALDPATLAALESITATISNLPSDYPDSATLAKLEQIRSLLAGGLTISGEVEIKNDLGNPIPVTGSVTVGGGEVEIKNDTGNPVPVSGQVSLDSATLAALETINVLIASGQIVGLDSTTLAALENIVVSGTVALDAPTLAALESVTASVSNFPSDFPDANTLAKLEQIRSLLATGISTTVSGEVEVKNDAGNPIPVSGQVSIDSNTLNSFKDKFRETLPLDIFANLVTGERENQIEVHYDDSNYATYLTHTLTSGGNHSQANGQATYASGSNATGRVQGTTLDAIKYRPMHEVYSGWTASFSSPAVAGWQRIGLFNSTDGVFIGYEATTFGITWRNGGGETFISRSSWDDPCSGASNSAFTRNGVPETLDTSKANIYRVRFGWLGAAGFIVEVMSPDLRWVPVYTLRRPNTQSIPFLSNADLPMSIDVGKTSGSELISISTTCWAGGTTSSKARLSDSITDRSLAETVRAVITGKTTAGGGGYVDVKVSPSGSISADVSGSTVALDAASLAALESTTSTISNFPAEYPLPSAQVTALTPQTNALTNAQLRASDVNVADSGEREYIHAVATVTAAGDTTVYTPASGKAIRLHWIYAINDPSSANPPLINVRLGSDNLYRVYALSKRQRKTGAIDAPLIFNLNQTGSVAVTVILEEV